MKKNIKLKKSEQIFIIVCLAVGLILRLHHALTTEYSIHPDEIMQYLERAHSIVFGNGLLWNEQALGMRSLLVPGFIAFWLWLCKILNLADPNVYIPLVKVSFVMLSMAVPIGVYRLARWHYGQTVAMASLVLVSLWYQVIYWAHKPITSVVSTSLIFLYFTFLFKEKATVEQQDEQKISSIRLWIMGLTLTLVLPIRIQYAPLCFCLLCYTLLKLSSWRERWHLVSSCFTGVLLFMGVLDWLTIGYPFQAMYNNIYYNVFEGMAARFGVTPFYQYFLWMGNTFSFFLWLTLIFAVIRLFKKDWLVFSCFLGVMIPLSMVGHKEPRFIFAATPFFLIMLSHWLTILSDWMTNKILSKRFINKHFSRKVISLWSLVIFLVLLNAYILKKNSFIQSGKAKNYSLYALKAIEGDPNATGVFDITAIRASSGGYYYLHKAIPYYVNYGIYDDRNTDDFRPYISHLIRRVNSKNEPIKYFFKWKNIGNLEIYKRIDKHYPQKMWNHYKVNKIRQHKKGRFALKNKRFKPPPLTQYVEPRQ